MAKVTGPLMSLDASGTVAGTATFSKWKGRNYVRQRVIPSNPQTAAQTAVRAMFAGLVALWKANTEALTAAFDTRAKQLNISAFNAFVGYNQTQVSQGKFPADQVDAVPVAPEENISDLDNTVANRTVELTWTASIDANVWLVLVYRKLGGDPTGTNSELVGSIPAGTTKFVDSGLTAGEWHYGVAAVTDSGGRFPDLALTVANVV